jgi:hypothetical protein
MIRSSHTSVLPCAVAQGQDFFSILLGQSIEPIMHLLAHDRIEAAVFHEQFAPLAERQPSTIIRSRMRVS